MRKKYLVLNCIIIVCFMFCTKIYAAGAQDSNPDKELGNGGGGGAPPYASGLEDEYQNKLQQEIEDTLEGREEESGTGTVTKQDSGKHTAGEIVDEAQGFIEKGKGETTPITADSLQEMSSMIYNILLVAGMIVAVAIAVILGIKWVTGGIEGQVEVKNMLVPYIVGCVVIFGAFTIWKIVLIVLGGLEA